MVENLGFFEYFAKIFDDLGVIEAEKKYLDGIGAQYDSEVIYHNMIKELSDKNVKLLFLRVDLILLILIQFI